MNRAGVAGPIHFKGVNSQTNIVVLEFLHDIFCKDLRMNLYSLVFVFIAYIFFLVFKVNI